MMSEFKSCLQCQSYRQWLYDRADGTVGVLHLCSLPADCLPPAIFHAQQDQDDRAPYERDDSDTYYVGSVCDDMRRMGGLCGPRANLWKEADA